VRISYAQLLDAVNSMVPGVEVWVQAQRELGIRTDIARAAVAICCSRHDCSVGCAGRLDTSNCGTRMTSIMLLKRGFEYEI
jgi:hypothetical protein